MTSFDYIASADFRASLESDYLEMQRCVEAGAWKSAQVLAGSMVEALLVDYLVSTSNASRVAKDPLKMDLAEVIAICKAEGALSERSADLCSVVRSYRNLIHPGRMVRLGEQSPSNTTCGIAKGLIDLIVDEIAKQRRATSGLTAEQILSKVVRDSDCIPILKHLLSEASEAQRARLLLELIPESYFSYLTDDESFNDTSNRLSRAFRVILETVPTATQEKVAQKFVQVLKEEDGLRVKQYRKAFFRASDLSDLSQSQIELVKEHLLGSVPTLHTHESLQTIEGLAPFLEPADCLKWLDPFIRTITSQSASAVIKKKCREMLIDDSFETSHKFDERMLGRLDVWVEHLKKLGKDGDSNLVAALKEEIGALGTP